MRRWQWIVATVMVLSIAWDWHRFYGPSEPRRRPIRPGVVSGQALAEFALVVPILLGVLIGTADVAILGWRSLQWQSAAISIAQDPTVEDAVLDGTGCRDASVAVTEADGLRSAVVSCTYRGPSSLLDGTKAYTGTAPMEGPPMP